MDGELTYIKLIHPPNFISNFSSYEEFREWCELGSVEDLECAIEEFSKHELYEYCEIMNQVINKIKDE